jgi:dihydrolipoamide dehydrogenase
MSHYDFVVIGAGPGGYACAIRAAQLGFKTLLIEKNPHLGGTCLNVGCIPSKALLHSTELFHKIQHEATDNGITVTNATMDIKGLMKKKEAVVNKLRAGLIQLMAHKKVEVKNGHAQFIDNQKLEIHHEGQTSTISANHIVIATGSTSIELPFMPFDGETVVSSDEGIAFTKTPKNLAIVGAGAIGLELGSVWARLGANVTIVELLPNVAPTFDTDISKMAEKLFAAQGIKFELGAKVTGVKKSKGHTYLTAERDGKPIEIEADKILVAVGRKPFAENLGLEKIGIELDERKRVKTDNHFRTNISNVYAIGDVAAGPMLAHKAEEEGIAVAEQIAGKAGHVNYAVIPNVVYTTPEIASVGLSENEAKTKGIAVRIGKMPFTANGRAIASDATAGLVKIIACAQTDRVLGVQMIGDHTSELIAEAVAHMEYGGSAEDIARTVHAHPTLSETFKEAALAVDKRAIHG